MKSACNRVRFGTLVIPLAAVLGLSALPVVQANAQTHTLHRHSSFIHRHPNATAAGAGIAAYQIAKHTGNRRARQGRRRNFFQRHPVITGVGAAALAHHYAKHHR
jgi:hypothetical protein